MAKTKRLSVIDGAFLTLDSAEVSAHVACLATFARPPDTGPEFLRELVAELKEARTFAPPFNYRLARSRLQSVAPSWEILSDDQVDLDYHFRHSALPWPGGQRELGVLVSRLHSRPLDPTRPLWECHLIEGLEHGRFALYFKVHHAMMDGVGGARRLASMLSEDPDDHRLRPVWTLGPPQRRTDSTLRTKISALTKVKKAARVTGGLATATADVVREARNPSDPAVGVPFRAPTTKVLNGRVSRQRRVATQSYDFQRIRTVAKAAEATVNDVFLAICAGALRRYLTEFAELPQDSLVTGAPVSVRRESDERSNAIAFVMVKLFTDLADPAERIKAINKSATLAKENLKRLPDEVADLYGLLTNGPFILQNITGTAGRFKPPYNLVISNVPGPQKPQYLRGARLDEVFPISIVTHGQALNITVFSTAGKFNVGFIGCRDLLPHMQKLAVYTGDALEELEAALGLS